MQGLRLLLLLVLPLLLLLLPLLLLLLPLLLLLLPLLPLLLVLLLVLLLELRLLLDLWSGGSLPSTLPHRCRVVGGRALGSRRRWQGRRGGPAGAREVAAGSAGPVDGVQGH